MSAGEKKNQISQELSGWGCGSAGRVLAYHAGSIACLPCRKLWVLSAAQHKLDAVDVAYYPRI